MSIVPIKSPFKFIPYKKLLISSSHILQKLHAFSRGLKPLSFS